MEEKQQYVIHKNCFAYASADENGCNALKRLFCKTENCKFFKTEREGKYPRTSKTS